jgi:hypothetical protein
MVGKAIAWRYACAAPVLRPPVVGGGLIVVFDESGGVHVLHSDGRPAGGWRIESPPFDDPVFLGRALIILFPSGRLSAFSPESAKERWRISLEPGVPKALSVWNDELLVAGGDGMIRRFSSSGERIALLDAGGAFVPPLFVDGDHVYASREDGFYFCINIRRMKIRWRRNIGGLPGAPPAVSPRSLFLAVSNGVLLALDKSSGTVRWWRPLPSRAVFGPTLWMGRIAAASRSFLVSSFHPDTGEPQGEYDAGSEVRANPLAIPGFLALHFFDNDKGEGSLLFLKEPDAQTSPLKSNSGGRNP